jgi:hypothetical protein
VIRSNGKIFTEFLYSDTLKKNIFFPVYAPSSVKVTRGFPVNPLPGERIDHPHHTGIWFNFGDVNNIDFWNNSYAIPEERRSHYGYIRVVDETIKTKDGKEGELRFQRFWVTNNHDTLIDEKVKYLFNQHEDLISLKRISIWSVLVDTMTLEDNKEGMFAIRVASEFESNLSDSLVLLNDELIAEKTRVNKDLRSNGYYRGSNGTENSDVWGTSNKWVSLSAEKDNDSITIVIMDHPENIGFPAHYHARGYGLFSIDNLGKVSFNQSGEPLFFEFYAGDSITFKHQMLIKSNGYLPDDNIDQLYEIWKSDL